MSYVRPIYLIPILLAAAASEGCGDDDTTLADAATESDLGLRDLGLRDLGVRDAEPPPDSSPDDAAMADATASDAGVPGSPCDPTDGQCIFRHDTFGDEQRWTDVLRLHELVQTLPPTMALALGLKVDADAVPADVLANADLEDPATTVALLELNAVVGVTARVEDGVVMRAGIACALCHSTVDDAVMPGIGSRLDGWPNRDLDSGAIIAATPGLPAFAASLGITTETARAVLTSWGPGHYDARLTLDGMSAPVLIPPAYGLAGVPLETYTGEGPITYWNAYVAVTQMGAQGTFVDERLGIDIEHTPDRVTPMLPALAAYQHSLGAPAPPTDSFEAAAAARGQTLFEGQARCAGCHAGASFTDAPMLHAPEVTGMDPTEAERSLTGAYRTTPLKGAWHRAPYFHDGSAATLEAVVEHYDQELALGLDESQKSDLTHYLRSL